jgi:hypothetical protein
MKKYSRYHRIIFALKMQILLLVLYYLLLREVHYNYLRANAKQLLCYV